MYMYIFVAAPVFQTRDLHELLSEGDSKRLTVKFTGLPAPDVEWRVGDSLVRGVQIDSSSTTSSLHIKDADRRKHAGVYTVTLKNKAGVATTEVTLDVTGKFDWNSIS